MNVTNIIGNATAKLWLLRNVVSLEGQSLRRFYELPLLRREHPALALSWTLYHILDEESPLYGLKAEDLEALAYRSRWWCRDMTWSRRRPSTPENPMAIPTFALGTDTPISSTPPTTAGSESTTVDFTKLWRIGQHLL